VKREGRRPDADAVIRQLKGFQRDTVDYAFDRLFLAKDSTHRFLVADEVGLGKTLVARGVIAKAIDHLWDTTDRIDIVYICSNADIARQNLNKLNPTKDSKFELASRATLLATTLHGLEERKLNFISFTPGTSFELANSLGQRNERALLYGLLKQVWGREGTGPLNLLQGTVRDKDRFREHVKAFNRDNPVDRSLIRSFADALRAQVASERAEGRKTIRVRFNELCDRFAYARTIVPQEDRADRNALIGELRAILAATCLRALEPDLVILDEFQRFKHLLSGDDEASQLARQLFDYANHHSRARVLLLSATPYKMYTLSHEREEDDHYADFLRTINFLDPATSKQSGLGPLLVDYRRELYRLGDGGGDRLLEIRQGIESSLRRVMARTERVGATTAADAMLTEVVMKSCSLQPGDVSAYVALQRIGDRLEQGQVVEYWKSAPYLLNFMDRSTYRLKEEFAEALAADGVALDLASELKTSKRALLPWKEVRAYEAVDPANARLRALEEDCLSLEQWKLLWLPPCLPYYPLGDAFERVRKSGFTKRLVFSTWNVVPKAVAAMISYEVERRIFREAEDRPTNSPEARRRRRGLLRFSRTEGRLTGMPVLALMYPCIALAQIGDPLEVLRRRGSEEAVSLDELRADVAGRLASLLGKLTSGSPSRGEEDERWYWAAPILLDRAHHSLAAHQWFNRSDLALVWAGGGADEDEDPSSEAVESGWAQHVRFASDVASGKHELGRPPRDLVDVCVLLALASPAVVALRALGRVSDGFISLQTLALRDAAARVGWAFRGLFNEPEAMALLRADESEQAYWRRVLEYSLEGGLQPVLDEYVHILRDLRGLFDRDRAGAAEDLAAAICEALSLRTSSLDVDVIGLQGESTPIRVDPGSMRSHFAARFGVARRDQDDRPQREDHVRTAFNSPFRPFVLVSTSIGQEGLDFHPYCHSVVHWNLPGNPVDLEQREGRVHRYKGHAIRKNVVQACGAQVLRDGSADPWARLFEIAEQRAGAHDNGLVPYWLFPVPGGAQVERRVPYLPLSSESTRFDALRRSLAIYRMVFGQPRQDDLLAYLLERLSPEQLENYRAVLRIDLSSASAMRSED